MTNIIDKFQEHCKWYNIPFNHLINVNSYDDTTLFCSAGMQQFKHLFQDNEYVDTFANIQPCIRMNDFDEIGDTTHLLYFNMIGLFSFRQWSIEQAIEFWVSFLSKLNVKPDYVTIHSERKQWIEYYHKLGITDVRVDDDNCTWTDGTIGGYCTEFFINDIEIGNIVNPLDNCIDVGFGLERLELIVNNKQITRIDTLKNTTLKLIENGYKPSNVKQGYVLRKLLREIHLANESIEHQYFYDELERQSKIIDKYNRLKDKHQDKSKEWWFDTHGIDITNIK